MPSLTPKHLRRLFSPDFLLIAALLASDLLIKRLFPQTNLNKSAVFSLPLPGWAIISTALIVITLLIVYLAQLTPPRYYIRRYALALVIAGGLSNTAERIFYHQVTDIIPFFNATINLADIIITVGLTILVFSVLLEDKKPHPDTSNNIK